SVAELFNSSHSLSVAAHHSLQLIHWFFPGASCCDRFRGYEPGEDRVTAESDPNRSRSSIARGKTRVEFRRGRAGPRFTLVRWTIIPLIARKRGVTAAKICFSCCARRASSSFLITSGDAE